MKVTDWEAVARTQERHLAEMGRSEWWDRLVAEHTREVPDAADDLGPPGEPGPDLQIRLYEAWNRHAELESQLRRETALASERGRRLEIIEQRLKDVIALVEQGRASDVAAPDVCVTLDLAVARVASGAAAAALRTREAEHELATDRLVEWCRRIAVPIGYVATPRLRDELEELLQQYEATRPEGDESGS